MLKKYIPSFVFCAGLLFLSGSAVADTQRSAMISCPKIPEAEARLKCFDLAAEKYAREMNGMQRKETKANASQKKAATFGQGYLKTSPDPKVRKAQERGTETELNKIEYTVIKSQYSPHKKFILYMQNGQVWQQKDGGRIPLPKGNFKVIIKKGALGGYNIILPTRRSVIKVKRVR
ncbi:hypothetical protein [Paremcibacter congregatus]|uniref:Uncharacterized protein n=1 Tax=Paremcibacter congregatus TaxID=2043170 RepID=A0A2G4YM94_9PROT|nr:hypothetical protein [Paremcibacter congregatus]PHZ83432.1 hypothetical protein CRD36_17905 [Paremcibacter congregatus]QDE28100.1 hypothetical protein FIV45_12900 [Paremcibacter congregatus]